MHIKRKRDNNAADNGRFAVLIYARMLRVLYVVFATTSGVGVEIYVREYSTRLYMICPNASVCECHSHNMQTHSCLHNIAELKGFQWRGLLCLVGK